MIEETTYELSVLSSQVFYKAKKTVLKSEVYFFFNLSKTLKRQGAQDANTASNIVNLWHQRENQHWTLT